MHDYEKLGVFYLGRLYDPAQRKTKPELLLYESKDLVTHGVCVGMTGSGKTGLCLSLLEEAAIDGIPAIAIDPKGDIGNLLLTFPDLRGEDFEPWINEDDARKKGVSAKEFAQQQADSWRTGLAEWEQDGDRIRRLRAAADFAIYTPGSTAGIPLSVIKSFAAPDAALLAEGELLRERITTTVSSLLGLLGQTVDPLQSREHILLSNILGIAWKNAQDLDLGALIQQIQNPPLARIGVVDLESFFPAKDRFAFAMQINNLLASPGFETWLKGEPLDIGQLLYTPAGKPRIAIISIAHLGDTERMFAVSLILTEMLSWVRTQPGTTSLRALLYMDEIFGFFPPVANPPSKTPLLTLLKQARAYGLGVVLATQNPVDLDYKGLSNAGTWFIGRLQTERDKARVLEGLEGAAVGHGSGFDRSRMEALLASLASRVFLMNNVHEKEPVVFQARWAMSYLRGPLTRSQIQRLTTDEQRRPRTMNGAVEAAKDVAAPKNLAEQRPMLPPEISQFFVPMTCDEPDADSLVYQPMLLACADLYFVDAKTKVDCHKSAAWLAEFTSGAATVAWSNAKSTELRVGDLEKEPHGPARYAALPATAGKPKSYDAWKKAFIDTRFRKEKLEVYRSPSTSRLSLPDESERDFRVRLQQETREQRDALVAMLREKYALKIAMLEERVRKAQQAVERETEQSRQSKFSTLISIGSTLVGAFLGRKTLSATNVNKAATAARGVGRTMKDAGDVARAQENVATLEKQLTDLEAKFQAEVDDLGARIDPATEALETITVKLKKSNVSVQLLTLVWTPYSQMAGGTLVSLWE